MKRSVCCLFSYIHFFMLQSADLHLRAIEPEDLDTLYTIENDTDVWNVGAVSTPYSRFALRQYIESQPADIFQTGQLRLAIVERATATTIGFVDLIDHSAYSARAEVGIALLCSHHGKGYGLQALRLIETYAFQQLHLRFLYAYVSADHNPVARQLFETAGYRSVAVLPLWHESQHGTEDIVLYQKFHPNTFTEPKATK